MKKVNLISVLVALLLGWGLGEQELVYAQPAPQISPIQIIALNCKPDSVPPEYSKRLDNALPEAIEVELGGLGFLCVPFSEAAKADVQLLVGYIAKATKGTPPYTEEFILSAECKLMESKTGSLIWSKKFDNTAKVEERPEKQGYVVWSRGLGSHTDKTNIPEKLAMMLAKDLARDFKSEFINFIAIQPVSSWTLNLYKKWLYSQSWEVRQKAAQILGEKSVVQAADWLIDVMKNDGYSSVRETALTSLVKLKDERAVEPLIIAMIIKEDRQAAARDLIILDKKGDLIKMALTWDKDLKTRLQTAQQVLGREKVLLGLKDAWRWQKSLTIAEAITELDPNTGLDFLREFTKPGYYYGTDTKLKALELLRSKNDPQLIESLFTCLVEKDVPLRKAVVGMLGDIPSEKSVSVLQEVMRSDSSE
ncbi:MAG: HEAT repeat domain-containing protein, partial [candidate division KSB1 bacterium]|nr:HEAT repeat domain-containing protein [candidate division KSB1 bacterium]